MMGVSLRFALAAGLHLRNVGPPATLEMETWCGRGGVYSQSKVFFAPLSGGLASFPTTNARVPLPQVSLRTSQSEGTAYSSERGDSDTVTRLLFLGAWIMIALILQKAPAKLYSPQLCVDSWGRIQTDTTDL